MDFVLDPRVWVPIVLGFIAFVGAWSSLNTRNDAQTKEIDVLKGSVKSMQETQNRHETNIALLQNDHKVQAGVIAELVEQLRDVVRDLQKIAIKLAIGEYGKA